MSNNKKVLFTSHTANFQKFNRPFMRWFSQQGWEVHYASMGEETVLDADQSFTVPFTRSPFGLSNIKAYRQLKKLIEHEQYDIIHTHTPMGSVVTRLAARRMRRSGTRVIYTAHGFHFYKGAPLINWLIYYPVEKLLARYTDTLITINQEDYKRAKNNFKTDVQYVSGVGVDPARFAMKLTKKQRNDLRHSLGLKPDDFVMIYPAELNKNKNQTMLINVMNKLVKQNPDIHLILAGHDSLDGYHKSIVSLKHLESNIHFLGYRSDIAELLQASDLSVSASYREGLPAHIIEAMAAGLPVVSTRCRGATELIVDGENGFLVDFNDVDSFASSITSIIDSKDQAAIGERGRLMSSSFSISKVMSDMSSIYFKKLTVLHLLASNKFSGAESVVINIIDQTKNQVNAYYGSPSGDICERLKKHGVHYVEISKLSLGRLAEAIHSINPDIIHAHDFKASIAASFFSKRIKIISHIHQNPDWLLRMGIKVVFYSSRLKYFSNIYVVSKAISKANIFKSAIADGRLQVKYNPIDKASIRKLSKEAVEYNYDLMFCGRLEAVKNPLGFISIVIEAKKLNANVRAVMVGDGSMRSECERVIKRVGLVKNIDLVGFQENPYKYMANSKALCITSINEGFGLVAAEAALLGVCVLHRDIPAIVELIGVAGLIDGDKIGDMLQRTYLISNTQILALPADLTMGSSSYYA